MGNKAIRKKRNTDYSMTQKLLKKIGEGRVVRYWQRHGMYKSAELLSIEMNEYVSPYVLRYMSNKYNWKRKCNPKSAIYRAVVIKKTMPAAYYKHLIFEVDENVKV